MPETDEKKLTFGSLFAGIGGIDLGLERAGMQCVWQVEIDDYATRVLEKHWPNVRRWRDITTFPPNSDSDQLWDEHRRSGRSGRQGAAEPRDDGSLWRVELICGGFPCQPISCAGKQLGERDSRWLWGEMHRVCSALRPRWVLAENVPRLLSAGNVRGDLFGKILRDLASIGYRVEWHCIPAAAVGAPHIRDRLFILGFADGNGRQAGKQGSETVDTGVALSQQVVMPTRWPTPNATDGNKAPKFHKGGNPSLPCKVEQDAALRDSSGAKTGTGQLNPTWVEWLMGFPTAWTDLDASETP